jgi:hypothetical protein
MTKIFTKDELISELKKIRDRGWIRNRRPGNSGGIGNTLEDLLGIEENNLPLPNASEWELKCQRLPGNSLITLFHMEPSPRALKHVPAILLPQYGWKHEEAGKKYPPNEMSFRQTINALSRTDRGFGIIVDRKNKKVIVSFDYKAVSKKHHHWLQEVEKKVGLGELATQPYWGFEDLFHKAATKLHNCFLVQAEVKKEQQIEFYHYKNIYILQEFSLDKFISAIEKGDILIDFDARSGHNHGTKFRIRQNKILSLFSKVTKIQ